MPCKRTHQAPPALLTQPPISEPRPQTLALPVARYAGHYVPAVAHKIYTHNKLGRGPRINLKGLAIGNGLTDPAIQYGAYADFALDNGLVSQGTHDNIKRVGCAPLHGSVHACCGLQVRV